MTNVKAKYLTYRRAIWFASGQEANNLAALISAVFVARPGIADTRYSEGNKRVDVRQKAMNGNTCHLQLTSYAVGEHASIVKQDHVAGKEELGTAPPPAEADYLDHDAYVRIENSDVFICTNGMSEKAIGFYLAYLVGLEHPAAATNFLVERVQAQNKVQQLLDEGVKAIELNVSDYAVEVDAQNERAEGPVERIWRAARALVEKDRSPEEVQNYSQIQSKIVYTFDGRLAGAEAEQILTDMAFSILDEVEDGFVIRTKTGSEISANDVSVKKLDRIEREGKSLKRDAAWAALDRFAQELKDAGICQASTG